ncbi:F-box/FBD/LRR-repeat protein [Melia azedarach]|uniref:F-box/FBD/LRR-repeat protein n=1 Tax=Melia azedarach TaxID=155640 RepID=A0ACC1YAY6_MELAZ|nr:F-box/FBD/LRR-repeat protein [Melia azedarach]
MNLESNFILLNLHEETITRWVYTAIAKGVQNLELDLNYMIGAWEGLEYQYGLPANFVRSLRQFSGFRCFKSLRFVNVGISRETVEFFIYNCPVLEELRVSHVDSQHFLGLKVVGSSIRLKYLELYCCFSIEELDISAPSLLSLKFYGSNIRRLKIENVPLLVDVSIGGTVYIQLKNLVEPIADYLTQLETLELSFNLDHDNLRFPLPALPKLKHLIFDALAPDNKNLRQLTLVMKACPFLQKFTLKLVHAAPSRRRIIRKFPKWSYEHLKEVTFVGFEAVPI